MPVSRPDPLSHIEKYAAHMTSSLSSNYTHHHQLRTSASIIRKMALSFSSVVSNIFGGFSKDFQKKNFSLYGQWISLFTIILCLALGVANIFHANLVIVFSIIAIVQGLLVLFVEVPFLLKICPLTDTFTNFVRNFDENWPRCGFYLLMSVIQWLSLLLMVTSLIVIAVLFLLSSLCYMFAAIKHQEYIKTSFNVAGENNDLESQAAAHVVRNVL